MRPRRNKYGVAAKPDRTYNGTVFHSKAEANYAARLDLLKRAGVISDWERQRPYQLVVNGNMIGKYVADFAVWRAEGAVMELHEIKGRETAEWRLKEKLFRALYPDIPLIVLDVKGREIRGREANEGGAASRTRGPAGGTRKGPAPPSSPTAIWDGHEGKE